MLAMRRKDGCLIRQMFRGRDIGRYLQKYEITFKYGLFVGGFFNLILTDSCLRLFPESGYTNREKAVGR